MKGQCISSRRQRVLVFDTKIPKHIKKEKQPNELWKNKQLRCTYLTHGLDQQHAKCQWMGGGSMLIVLSFLAAKSETVAGHEQ